MASSGSSVSSIGMVSGYGLDRNLCLRNNTMVLPLDSVSMFGIDAISFRACEFMMEMVEAMETVQEISFKHRLSCNLRRQKKSATVYNDKMKVYRRTLRKLEERMLDNEVNGGHDVEEEDGAKKGTKMEMKRALKLRNFSNALEFDYRNKLSAQQLVSSLTGQSRNEIKPVEKALPETILNLLKYGEGDQDGDDLFLSSQKHAVDQMVKRIDDVFMELSLDRMSRNSFKSWTLKYCRLNRKRYESALDRLFSTIAAINKVHYLDFIEPQHIGNVVQFLFHQQQHRGPKTMHKMTIKLLLALYGADRHSISHHDLFQSMLSNSHSLFPNDYNLILRVLDNKKRSKHRQCLQKQRTIFKRSDRHRFNVCDLTSTPSCDSADSSVSTITAITQSDNISPVITAKDLERAPFHRQQLDVVLFLLIAFRCEEFVDDGLLADYKAKSAVFGHAPGIQSDVLAESLTTKQFQHILFRFIAPNHSEMIENNGDCNQIVEALLSNLSKTKQRMVTAKTATDFFVDIERNIGDEVNLVNTAFDFYDKQNRNKIYPSDLLHFEDTILGIILQKDLHRMFHQLFLQYIATSIDTHLTRKQFQQLFERKISKQSAAKSRDKMSSSASVHWETPQIINFFSNRSCD